MEEKQNFFGTTYVIVEDNFNKKAHNESCKSMKMTYSSPLLSAFEFFERSKDCGVSFVYRGPFMDDLTSKIIDISEKTCADKNDLPKVSRKVSFLLVECFQNIVRHGETSAIELANSLQNGLFSFKNIGNAYVINSINLVDAHDIHDLKQQVEFINGLDGDQLREAYREKLEHNVLSGKGGAGLGLFELARKSGQKIKYKFELVNDEIALFHQQILFLKDSNEEIIDHIEFTNDTLTKMQSENLLLQYKGDFSTQSISPLFKIVEDSVGGSPSEMQRIKKVGDTLIEILTNISEHGEVSDGLTDGVFLIGSDNGNVFIEAGNPIKSEKLEQFKECLDHALSLSDEEITSDIESSILESFYSTSEDKSRNGLLEIVKSTTKPLHYNFNKTPDGKVFFSLRATV